MNFSFPKRARLRTRRQYQNMARPEQRAMGHWIVVDICTRKAAGTRLGITVTRRYGKAHERNRFKRIVREAFRLTLPELPLHLDLHIKPRSTSYTATTQQIQDELLHLTQKKQPVTC